MKPQANSTQMSLGWNNFAFTNVKNFIFINENIGIYMTPFLLSQLIAGVSFVLDVSAFHFSRKKTLWLLALSTFLLSIHFSLLSQPASAALMLLAACRYVTAIFSTRQALCWMFLALSILCCLWVWQGPKDLFPLIGSLFVTYAAFQKHPSRMRIFTVLGSGFWVVNNILSASPVATLMELAFLSSTLLSYFRNKRALAKESL